jgi:hypothetical protein
MSDPDFARVAWVAPGLNGFTNGLPQDLQFSFAIWINPHFTHLTPIKLIVAPPKILALRRGS